MIYEYNSKVVNYNNNFYDPNKFVGYILPDGTIYQCENHNITNVYTFLRMFLKLLDIDYKNKNEILDEKTNDKLAKVVLNKLRSMSHDEIHALLEFIESRKVLLSDILVCFFDCHLITRLRKNMITSEINHERFYNYLLNDFKVKNIPKIIYDQNTKKCRYSEDENEMVFINDRNGYLYDEIGKIKEEVCDENINLFMR